MMRRAAPTLTCLRLHSKQPFRDLVWLRRDGINDKRSPHAPKFCGCKKLQELEDDSRLNTREMEIDTRDLGFWRICT